jgi:hypothetical protein
VIALLQERSGDPVQRRLDGEQLVRGPPVGRRGERAREPLVDGVAPRVHGLEYLCERGRDLVRLPSTDEAPRVIDEGPLLHVPGRDAAHGLRVRRAARRRIPRHLEPGEPVDEPDAHPGALEHRRMRGCVGLPVAADALERGARGEGGVAGRRGRAESQRLRESAQRRGPPDRQRDAATEHFGELRVGEQPRRLVEERPVLARLRQTQQQR